MIEFKDYKKNLTEDQYLYIKQLAEIEFYVKRMDYHLCINADNEFEFIHEQFIDDETKVKDEEREALFKKINEQKISRPPLSPIELQLKKSFIKYFKSLDEKIENKRDISETVIQNVTYHEDYYKENIFDKIQKIKYIIFGVLVIAAYGVYRFVDFGPNTASIKFATDHKVTQVYNGIDTLSINDNRLDNVVKGEYEFTLFLDNGEQLLVKKAMYNSPYTRVDLKSKAVVLDTADIKPAFIRFNTNESGFIAYIDQERAIEAENGGWVRVNQGEHVFEVSKEGYVSQPSFRNFLIPAFDSIDVNFNFKEETKNVSVFNAVLEITSNTKGADIFINGSKTNYKTDHTFQNMKEGIYNIEVQLDGYKSKEPSKSIVISKARKFYSQNFDFEKKSAFVTVNTKNVQGDIFLDGKKMGSGRFVQQLQAGSYTLSFGDAPGFYTPPTRKLTVGSNNVTLNINYFPVISYSLGIGSNRFESRNFTSDLGYSQFDYFRVDQSKGPLFESRSGKNYIVLKHPFPYNNPKAGQGMKFQFTLPNTYNYLQTLYLDLYLGYSKESYDIAGEINPEFSIYVNNKTKLLNQKMTLSSEEASRKKYQRFKINELLKNGPNEIIIYVSDRNTVVSHFYGMELRKQ